MKNKPAINAWLSGAICGQMYWPVGQLGSININATCRGPWGFYSKGDSWRDALNSLLMKKGGDFSGSQFTADTVIRFELRVIDGPGRWHVRVKELAISELPNCADLVNADAMVSDFCHAD